MVTRLAGIAVEKSLGHVGHSAMAVALKDAAMAIDFVSILVGPNRNIGLFPNCLRDQILVHVSWKVIVLLLNIILRI